MNDEILIDEIIAYIRNQEQRELKHFKENQGLVAFDNRYSSGLLQAYRHLLVYCETMRIRFLGIPKDM